MSDLRGPAAWAADLVIATALEQIEEQIAQIRHALADREAARSPFHPRDNGKIERAFSHSRRTPTVAK